MNKITDRTVVSLGLVITIIGGVIWLTTIFNQSDANAFSIKEIKLSLKDAKHVQAKSYNEIIKELRVINGRLIRIEGKINNDY